MRNSISESITSTVRDLNKSGLVDDITMKNIEYTWVEDSENCYTLEEALNILETGFCTRNITGNDALRVLTDTLMHKKLPTCLLKQR